MNHRVCAIVGVGPGIGLAVARRFAREGLRIALLARRETALAAYAMELGASGAEVHIFAVDVADRAALIQAFQQVIIQVGTPDVLVYNASAMAQGTPSVLDAEDLLEAFQVNVVAALVCVQQVLPQMRAQQRGTILLTGGGLALRPVPELAGLAIGKAGLRSLSHSLAAELAGDGIHVATVTICGYVQPGTYFDPDRIAEIYWDLYCQEPAQWEPEVVYGP